MGLVLSFWLITSLPAQATELVALERAVAERPTDVAAHRKLADAYAASGRLFDAVAERRTITELTPNTPAAWYALGHAYNAVARGAMRDFEVRPDEAPWRQLLMADTLAGNHKRSEAFAFYRRALQHLPGVVTIHDAIARIYDQTNHPEWATIERATAARIALDCGARSALCAFRAGRHLEAFTAARSDHSAESRYVRVRAATELARAAFAHLETLPDSAERRAVRATIARAEDRQIDAIAELEAALTFAPGDRSLTFELASVYYAARDYERTLKTLDPLLRAHPDAPQLVALAGYAHLQQRQPEAAVPFLRRAMEHDAADPGPRLALGRAYLHIGDFAAAIPLLEEQLAGDRDGSLHVQLARAYTGVGQRDKAQALLTRSTTLQRESAAAPTPTITAPKEEAGVRDR
jgi:predicted Zn-dependent protease